MPSSNVQDSQTLWTDDVLDRIKVLKFSLTSEAELKSLAQQFIASLKAPTLETVTLICGCIANLTDVFRGDENSLFVDPGSDANRVEDITIPATQMTLTLETKNETKIYSYYDPRNPKDKINVEYNEASFYDWLLADYKRIRPTLGILSLSLLRLYTRSAENAMLHCNGKIYTQWGQLFNASKPPKALHVELDAMKKIKLEINNSDDNIRRVIAMLVRKFSELEETDLSKAHSCSSYILYTPIAFHGFDLFKAMDAVKLNTGWTVLRIWDLINSTGIPILKNQIENYCSVYAHIARGLKEDGTNRDGRVIRTMRFYMFARALDGTCFASISPFKNRELVCFLIGLAGEPVTCKTMNMWAVKEFPNRADYHSKGLEIFQRETSSFQSSC